jgi:hypothetical protein
MLVELFKYSLSETDELLDKCHMCFVIHKLPVLLTFCSAGRDFVYIKK